MTSSPWSPSLAPVVTPLYSSTTNALSTASEVILPVRHNRIAALLLNTDASITIYVGNVLVDSTQFPLRAGASMIVTTKDALYAVAASGTPTLAIYEEVS